MGFFGVGGAEGVGESPQKTRLPNGRVERVFHTARQERLAHRAMAVDIFQRVTFAPLLRVAAQEEDQINHFSSSRFMRSTTSEG